MKIIEYKQIDKKLNNEKFQRKYWEHHWKTFDLVAASQRISTSSLFLEFKKHVRRRDRIIEAGCGSGKWLLALSRLGYIIEGVDFARKTVRSVKKKYPELEIYAGDVRFMSRYSNESIDAYLSFGVVEHFPEGPQIILREANRVLRKGGILFLTVPYLNKVRLLKYLLGERTIRQGQFYQYLYSKSEIRAFIKNTGFEIIKTKPWDFLTGMKRDFPFLYNFFIKKLNKKINVNKKQLKKSDNRNIFQKKLFVVIEQILSHFDAHCILIIAKKNEKIEPKK